MNATDRSHARREREVARTRDDILTAAATAFARQGFEATTMQAIAKEAGYTAPSLYSYFKSKDEIVEALFERIRAEFRAVFDEAIPSTLDFRGRLDLIVRRQLALLDERSDAVTCFLVHRPPCGVTSPPLRGTKLPPSGFDLHAARLTDWLKKHATQEDLGGHDFVDAAYGLIGIQHAYFRRWLGGPRKTHLAHQTDLILNLFLHGMSGPATRATGNEKKKR